MHFYTVYCTMLAQQLLGTNAIGRCGVYLGPLRTCHKDEDVMQGIYPANRPIGLGPVNYILIIVFELQIIHL